MESIKLPNCSHFKNFISFLSELINGYYKLFSYCKRIAVLEKC